MRANGGFGNQSRRLHFDTRFNETTRRQIGGCRRANIFSTTLRSVGLESSGQFYVRLYNYYPTLPQSYVWFDPSKNQIYERIGINEQ